MTIRKILLIVGGLLLLATTSLAVVFLNLPRVAMPNAIDVVATPETVERGRYLTINVLQCVDCHSVRDWTRYGGPPVEPIGAGRPCLDRVTPAAGVNVGQEVFPGRLCIRNITTRYGGPPVEPIGAGRPCLDRVTPAAGVNVGQEVFPGRLCIRNITSDMDTGLGKWTDGEVIRAIREGVGRDGSGLFPIMPYFVYRDLSDEDVQAVVAFLRTLPPARSNQPPGREIDFPLNLMVRLWPRPVEGKVIAPDRERDPLAYGRYLSRIARCEFCHSPREPRSSLADRALRVLPLTTGAALSRTIRGSALFWRYAFLSWQRSHHVSDEFNSSRNGNRGLESRGVQISIPIAWRC